MTKLSPLNIHPHIAIFIMVCVCAREGNGERKRNNPLAGEEKSSHHCCIFFSLLFLLPPPSILLCRVWEKTCGNRSKGEVLGRALVDVVFVWLFSEHGIKISRGNFATMDFDCVKLTVFRVWWPKLGLGFRILDYWPWRCQNRIQEGKVRIYYTGKSLTYCLSDRVNIWSRNSSLACHWAIARVIVPHEFFPYFIIISWVRNVPYKYIVLYSI